MALMDHTSIVRTADSPQCKRTTATASQLFKSPVQDSMASTADSRVFRVALSNLELKLDPVSLKSHP